MNRNISFKDSLFRYFDQTFHRELKAYVEGEKFKKHLGVEQTENISFMDICHKNIIILGTNGTAVTFFIKFTFSYYWKKLEFGEVECTCIWDIPLGEDGLCIGLFLHDREVPTPQIRYGDDLVPYITRDNYSEVAKLFIKKVFGDVVPDTSGYLFALDVINKLKLKTIACSLPETCTGKIIMVDKLLKFKNGDGTTEVEWVKAGTILFDYRKAALMSPSLLATTLIHESFHWVFHRCAFELGRLYRKTDEGFICYSDKTAKGSKVIEGNKFIEIQTNAVVPFILVSPEQLCNEAKSIVHEYTNSGYSKPRIMELIMSDLRNIHNLSVDSLRRCLVAGGLTAFRGISIYQDDHYLQSFCFEKDALEEGETFCLPRKEMSRLYKEDEEIRNLVLKGRFVYADGHLVLNDPSYVRFKDLITPELTEEALCHADQCFMKFSIERKNSRSPVRFEYGLDRIPSKEMEAVYNAIYDTKLTSEKRFEARKKWNDHVREWMNCERRTFGETFKAVMKFRKKPANFFEGKGLSQDQVYRLYKNESSPQIKTLVTIGGCLNMPYEVFIWFVEKAGLDFYTAEPELIKYKEFMDDRSLFNNIAEFDDELIRSGFKPLSKETKAR